MTQIELLEESLIQYISEMMIYYMKTWTQLGISQIFFYCFTKVMMHKTINGLNFPT